MTPHIILIATATKPTASWNPSIFGVYFFALLCIPLSNLTSFENFYSPKSTITIAIYLSGLPWLACKPSNLMVSRSHFGFDGTLIGLSL